MESEITLNGRNEGIKGPKEGEWFDVDIKTIDKKLFRKPREDKKQEETRIRILEAFEEIKKRPARYARPFQSFMPPKKETYWELPGDLMARAVQIGDQMGNWVEQSLEWAQRITNGEPWEKISNEPDEAKWYRMVIGKDGYLRGVGGSSEMGDKHHSPSTLSRNTYCSSSKIGYSVPYVVRYK